MTTKTRAELEQIAAEQIAATVERIDWEWLPIGLSEDEAESVMQLITYCDIHINFDGVMTQ